MAHLFSARFAGAVAVIIGTSLFRVDPAAAESLSEALASAYANNPTLNAQRASQRATDEGVPQALSGFRPTVSGSADVGVTSSSGATLRIRAAFR